MTRHPDYGDYAIMSRRQAAPSVSWWVGLSREKFHDQALIEALRMLKLAGDPVVKSIRPMVLGGKLP